MARQQFQPEQVETELVTLGYLEPRIATDHGALGWAERFFTEDDSRFMALWRLTMVRQLQPHVLRRLSTNDLMFIAAETASGYDTNTRFGIDSVRNKLEQNALRARIELDRRSRRTSAWQQLAIGVSSALAGVVVGVWLT